MGPFIEQIMPCALNFAPRGWAFCHGQMPAVNDHQDLFSLIDKTCGGDRRTTFQLPDLQRHVIVGMGNNYRHYPRGGVETPRPGRRLFAMPANYT